MQTGMAWYLFFVILIIHVFHITSQCESGDNKLVQYKLLLKTYWSRERFPKHYPRWNPRAQFGKLIGRTHNSSYSLYRLGVPLPSGTLQYIENGNSDEIDGESPSILDSFSGPKLFHEQGSNVARAFLDSNHTLVSFIMRINPSPDWFIGIASFSLCVKSKWVDTVTLELDPLDGGTDDGLTFTAESWPTKPKGIAYRITSRYPAHHSSSFYYPNLPRLPPIATLTFQKLKEYTLNDNHHRASFVGGDDHNGNNRYRYSTEGNSKKSTMFKGSRNKNKIINKIFGTNEGLKEQFVGDFFSDKNYKENVISSTYPGINSTFIYKKKIDGFRKMKNNHYSRLNNNGKRFRLRLSRDCIVDEWSSWSACTRTCGVGETQRTRKITVKPRRNGAPCPLLKDSKWCGSINPCPLIK